MPHEFISFGRHHIGDIVKSGDPEDDGPLSGASRNPECGSRSRKPASRRETVGPPPILSCFREQHLSVPLWVSTEEGVPPASLAEWLPEFRFSGTASWSYHVDAPNFKPPRDLVEEPRWGPLLPVKKVRKIPDSINEVDRNKRSSIISVANRLAL
ncbi:hypothetical protein EDB19DRAFT_1827507 [Suillus lakei]|nr:hypothetical protein EDB19DRAFT_1827507 [Suillus lakei]